MPQVFAALAGIGTAIGGAAGGLAASTSIGAILAANGWGAFAIRLGASLLLSVLAQSLAPRARERGLRIGEADVGEDTPQSFPLGVVPTAGSLTYRGSHGTVGGTPNSFYTQVFELSSLPGAGLRRVMVDREWTTLGGTPHPDYGSPMLALRRDGVDYGWVKFYDGTQTDADAGLVSAYGSDPDQPWTSAHIGTGIAYAIITLRFEREQRFPQRFVFELDGIPVYDPRKDSSAGGSGAHRFNNPATWETSDNPLVLVYNTMRGIALPGGAVYGGGVAAADLPLANWFAAMNACDTLVGSRRSFRAGLMVSLDTEPADVLDALLDSALARISENGGVFRVRVGVPPSPVLSITDEDVVISAPQEFTLFPGLGQTYNGVQVTHPARAALWEPATTAVAGNSAWVTEDEGRVLVAQVSLPAVYDRQQARQIARALARDNRRFRLHQVVLPPEYGRLSALDVISWTSPRNGYVTKAFEVLEEHVIPGTMATVLTLREVDPDDYSWDSGDDLPDAPLPTPTAPAARFLADGDWNVVPAAVEDENGEPRRPSLRITWEPLRVTDAQNLRAQVRVLATSSEVARPLATASDGELLVTEGIVPGVEYDVRLRPVIRGRATLWSNRKSVLAEDVYFGEGDIAPTLVQIWNEAFARHDLALGRAAGNVAQLYQEFVRLRDAVDAIAEQGLTESSSIAARAQRLAVQTTETRRALIELQQFVESSDTAAIALQLETILAQVDDNIAQINTLSATRVTEAGAVAAVNQTISAQYGSIVALAEATAFAEATVDGISSGFVWSLGGGDVLSLVRVDDGVSPPVTTARINAQYIRLDGDVEVTGTFLSQNAIFAGADIRSDNFSAGSTGWRITRSGNAEFNNLIARGSLIVGAVSDSVEDTALSNQTITSTSYATLATVTLVGGINSRNWTMTASGSIRRQVSNDSEVPFASSRIEVQRRVQYSSSDSYSAWITLSETFQGNQPFFDWYANDTISGRFHRIQYRIRGRVDQVITASGNQTNFRRIILSAQIPVI